MLFEYFNEFLGDIVGSKNAVIVLIGLLLVIYGIVLGYATLLLLRRRAFQCLPKTAISIKSGRVILVLITMTSSKNGISLITHIVVARLIVAHIVAVGVGNGRFRLA